MEFQDDNLELIRRILPLAVMDKRGLLRLPAERVLAEKLDVQRAKIRDALALLENFGFIKRLQGNGTFIEMPKPYFAQVYFDIAIQLGFISVEAMDSARETLEQSIAPLAAKDASPQEIAELRRLCDVMVSESHVEEIVDADIKFHTLLAAMTRNPVIVILLQSLAPVLRGVLLRRRSMVAHSHLSSSPMNTNHYPIVEALERRDPEAARQAMAAHFSYWHKEYQISAMLKFGE